MLPAAERLWPTWVKLAVWLVLKGSSCRSNASERGSLVGAAPCCRFTLSDSWLAAIARLPAMPLLLAQGLVAMVTDSREFARPPVWLGPRPGPLGADALLPRRREELLPTNIWAMRLRIMKPTAATNNAQPPSDSPSANPVVWKSESRAGQ